MSADVEIYWCQSCSTEPVHNDGAVCEKCKRHADLRDAQIRALEWVQQYTQQHCAPFGFNKVGAKLNELKAGGELL